MSKFYRCIKFHHDHPFSSVFLSYIKLIVEDCFTPWLIHDVGEIIFIIFKEFIFRSQAFKL